MTERRAVSAGSGTRVGMGTCLALVASFWVVAFAASARANDVERPARPETASPPETVRDEHAPGAPPPAPSNHPIESSSPSPKPSQSSKNDEFVERAETGTKDDEWDVVESRPAAHSERIHRMAPESEPRQSEPLRRLSLSLSLGTTSSGPAADIESAMTKAGFNQTSYGFWGPSPSPFSRTGFGEIGYPWMFALRYSPSSLLLLGFIASNAPIGESLGLHESNLYLFIKYSVSTVASTASVSLADVLHVGLGPAIYVASSRQDEIGTDINITSATKIGALLDVGLSVPAHSRFFVVGSFQYRYVGRADVGPFKSTLGGYFATMPSASARFNHTFTSLGFGIRL